MHLLDRRRSLLIQADQLITKVVYEPLILSFDNIYRSDKNFASERYKEKGIGVKPIPNDKDAQLPEGIEGVTEFAEQIRMEQLSKPHNQRLYIGGELNMILMLNDSGNPVTYQAKVHRFTSYDADREAIMARSPEDRLKNFPQISDPFTK